MVQIGDTFHRLKVTKVNVEQPEDKKDKEYLKKIGRWCECKCTCKNIIVVPEACLRNGSIKSCGCLKKELGRQQLELNRKNGIKPHNPNTFELALDEKSEAKSLTEWAKEIGISKQALSTRLKRMPLQKALTMKAGGNSGNKTRHDTK